MGGKKQTSQRTKNNVRPSNSARSAEFLMKASMKLGPSFDEFKQQLPIINTEPSEELLGIEFVLAFKKVNKKDPITKTKALQEIHDLVEKSDLERVKALLPFWASTYQLLTMLTSDTEHKVREATQLAHSVIVKKCGRSIAPHLKRLMPSWLMAQHDSFAPAAALAQTSLQSVFPENKLPEVLSFCKCEIVEHVVGNLCGDIEKKDTVIKNANPEELECRAQRIITSNLQLLDFFLQHIPEDQLDWLWDEQKPILESIYFWKYASHKVTTVRSAWFIVISREIGRYPEQIGSCYGAKILKILIGNLGEKDPIVSMQIWDCFLLLIDNVKDWYSWVPKKEDLRRRIIELVRDGGRGNSSHLAPLLLPLLAKLPTEMVDKEFYLDFVGAMIYALSNKSILSSKSNRQAWLTSMSECLRLVSTKHIDTFGVEVITCLHRDWLEKLLKLECDSNVKTNVIKFSASNMSSDVKYWLKMSIESELKDKYDQLVRNFWENIRSTIIAVIARMPLAIDVIETCINDHIDLILTLKSHKVVKKKVSVAFVDTTVETPVKVSKSFDFDCERFAHYLNDLAHKVCSEYVQFSCKTELSGPVLSVLIRLIREFNTKELFISIANDFDGVNKNDLYDFYEKVLKKWLTGDTMRCKSLIDIIFTMILYLSNEQQELVFASFKQLLPSLEEQCLTRALSHEFWSSTSIRKWLESSHVAEILQRVCKRLLIENDDRAKNLLMIAFTSDNKGDLLVGSKAGREVLDRLCEATSKLENEVTIRTITQLLAVPKLADTKILLKLFDINCNTQPNESLSSETWWEVRTCWQDNAITLAQNDKDIFYEEAIKVLHDRLFESDKISLNTIDNLIDIATSLLPKFNEQTDNINMKEILEIFSKIIMFKSCSHDTLKHNALKCDIVRSNLNCLAVQDEVINDMTESIDMSELSRFIKQCIFISKLIDEMTIRSNGSDENEEDVFWSEKILAEEDFEVAILELLKDYALLQSLEVGFRFWKYHSTIDHNLVIIEKILKSTLSILMPDVCGRYYKDLTEKSLKKGFYWSLALAQFCQMTDKSFDVLVNSNADMSAVGFFHNIQAAMLNNPSDCKLAYETNMKLAIRCFCSAHLADGSPVKIGLTDSEVNLLTQDSSDILSFIATKHYETNAIMIFDKDLESCEWRHVLSNAQILNFLSSAISLCGWELDSTVWDFINISISSVFHTLFKSVNKWDSVKFATLCKSLLNLYVAASTFIAEIKRRCEREQPSETIINLPQEWLDVFQPDINQHFYEIALAVLEKSQEKEVSPVGAMVLNEIENVAEKMLWKYVPNSQKFSQLSIEKITKISLKALCELQNHTIKFCAYAVLNSISKYAVLDDVDIINEWSLAENDEVGIETKPDLSLSRYDNTFTQLYQRVLKKIKSVKPMEESAELAPFTEDYILTLGFMLISSNINKIISWSHSDLEIQYIEWLKAGHHKENSMDVIIRLLPSQIVKLCVDRSHDQTQLPQHLTEMFQQQFNGKGSDKCTSESLTSMACTALVEAVGGGGDGARGWWSSLSSRPTHAFARLIASTITPMLIQREWKELQTRFASMKDVQVSLHPSSGEMLCQYATEEKKLNLQITLSKDHPLIPPKVQTTAVFVNTHWINIYLAYQNGHIWRAVEVWVESASKKLNATSACYICYLRMHHATGQLPNTLCKTCTNKFHSKCLYKWFKSSGKTSCPLCRAKFYH